MTNVNVETLERQLQRYKKSLGELPPTTGAEPTPDEGKVVGAGGESHEPKAPSVWDKVASPTMLGGKDPHDAGAIVPGEGEGGGTPVHATVGNPDIIPVDKTLFNVHEALVDLYGLQITRIGLEAANEKMVGKLMPGTGLEVNVATQILKTIHVVQGDLGLRHQEPTKNVHAVGIGVDGDALKKLEDSGLLRVVSNQKSRKRILNALGAASPLGGATIKGEVSDGDGEGLEGAVIEGEAAEK